MIIILLGPPGSGKGTQAELLSKKLKLYHFSAGDVFRQIKSQDKEIAEVMEEGDLLPDVKVDNIIEGFLEGKGEFEHLIIDGSPRSKTQYVELKDFFKKHNVKIDHAILIDISDAEAMKRLSARREDKSTGKIYNLVTNPPGPEVNTENLMQRDDDKEEAIRERLKVQKIPKDLINALKDDGILMTVNGERPPDEIHKDIVEKLNIGIKENL